MNPRQERFVAEYLIDLNATRAAIRAGYSAKTAHSAGPRLLENVGVAAAIAARRGAMLARLDLKAEHVLEQLRRLVHYDPAEFYDADGNMKPIHEIPAHARSAIAGLETDEIFEGRGEERVKVGETKKLKLSNRLDAVQTAMRHLGLLKDRDGGSGGDRAILMIVDGPQAQAIIDRIASRKTIEGEATEETGKETE
jgi:phage terminase small subunit